MAIKRIGVVANTIGLAGDIKVLDKTDFVEQRFAKGNKVIIGDETYTISSAKPRDGIIVVHLQEVNDINQALLLKGLDIKQDVELEEGFFFLDDVKDFVVVDESGKEYGKVKDYQEMNGLVYFVVGRFLLPYIKEKFVNKIDFENKSIVITDLATGIFE